MQKILSESDNFCQPDSWEFLLMGAESSGIIGQPNR